MFLEILAGVALLAGFSRFGEKPPVNQPKQKREPIEENKEVKSADVKVNLLAVVTDEILFLEESFTFTDYESNKTTLLYSDIYSLPTLSDDNRMVIINNSNIYNIYVVDDEKTKLCLDKIYSFLIPSISQSISLCYELSTNNYLRESTINNFNYKLIGYAKSYKELKEIWESKFEEEVIVKLNFLEGYSPLSKGGARLRELYESKKLDERKTFYDHIESNPLTKQQRLAVIREDDLNLILAAAGTGKTSVIVAKALDLISESRSESNAILVLAYNNSAAKELKERLLRRGEACNLSKENCPSVFTFHALGRQILKETKTPTYLSEFTDDPTKLEMWVTKWLSDYINSSHSYLKTFIKLLYQPINPFDFKSKDEYDSYIRDNEFRTLNGEKVKGYQELIIANWFFLNSVDYEYEAPYVSKRRIEVGFDYRPDFHFKNTDIYLEHFGIDREGNTRKDICNKEYNLSIQNKRKLHHECGTILIETYHYDWTENNLEKRLHDLIKDAGLTIRQKSSEEIYDTLNNMGFIDEFAKRYCRCMQALRFEKLDKTQALSRLIKSGIVYAEEHMALLNDLHNAYKKELKRQDRIDFDDMILKSTEAIIDGRFKPAWKYILVDEFQDISMARMDLLKALVRYGPVPVLSVVGDDWQSIYRFNGGKLELTTRIGDTLGSHTLTKLEKTFRYSSSIAEVAGSFIMKNPEQFKKDVKTITQDTNSQVFLVDSKVGNDNNISKRVIQIIEKIKQNDNKGSIAVLARYNYLLGDLKKEKISSKIHYWTFHRSKGLEADYCILIGFIQGKTGFPNMNKEEAVLEALLPSLDKYPHSEERRLFYVAMTRARKKCYLIADPMAPSKFIDEILTPEYNLRIHSKSFESMYREIYKCPLCTDGYFILKHGKHGDFYVCSSGSVCPSKPRKCEGCGAPSIDERNRSVCRNKNCGNEKVICDICGRPMKIRKGPYGEFWGCTGYGIMDDQCKNTRQIY